jgi:hypothetical protein
VKRGRKWSSPSGIYAFVNFRWLRGKRKLGILTTDKLLIVKSFLDNNNKEFYNENRIDLFDQNEII